MRGREKERRKEGKDGAGAGIKAGHRGRAEARKPGRPEAGGLGRSHDRTSTEHQMRENGD